MGPARRGAGGAAKGGRRGAAKGAFAREMARVPTKAGGALEDETVHMYMSKMSTREASFIVLGVSGDKWKRAISPSPIGVEPDSSVNR